MQNYSLTSTSNIYNIDNVLFSSASISDCGFPVTRGRYFHDINDISDSNIKVQRTNNNLHVWGCYVSSKGCQSFINLCFTVIHSPKQRWKQLAAHFIHGYAYNSGPYLVFEKGFACVRNIDVNDKLHDCHRSLEIEAKNVTVKHEYDKFWRVDCGEFLPFWCLFELPNSSPNSSPNLNPNSSQLQNLRHNSRQSKSDETVHQRQQLLPHIFPEFQSLVLEYVNDWRLYLECGDMWGVYRAMDNRLLRKIRLFPPKFPVCEFVNRKILACLLETWKQCPRCARYQETHLMCRKCRIETSGLVQIPQELRQYIPFSRQRSLKRNRYYVTPKTLESYREKHQPVYEMEERIRAYPREQPDALGKYCTKVVGKGRNKRLCKRKRMFDVWNHKILHYCTYHQKRQTFIIN